MAILRPVNLRGIQGAVDDPKDLCAHGDVEFHIDDDILLDPATGKDLTVSAAALDVTISGSSNEDMPRQSRPPLTLPARNKSPAMNH